MLNDLWEIMHDINVVNVYAITQSHIRPTYTVFIVCKNTAPRVSVATLRKGSETGRYTEDVLCRAHQTSVLECVRKFWEITPSVLVKLRQRLLLAAN